MKIALTAILSSCLAFALIAQPARSDESADLGKVKRSTGEIQGNLFARPRSKEKNATPANQEKVIANWLELYSLVSSQPLSQDRRLAFRKSLEKLLASSQKSQFESIERFWPAVEKEIKAEPEQKENYATLFRALLRLEVHNHLADDMEADLLSEVLGPERIAVPGTPALTEEAVDAYADMACFLYAANHPGKSVDATDNRVIFASVVARKFTEAPSLKDKQAMASFALKWSKFKILYASANELEKDKLVQKINGNQSANVSIDVVNPALDAVLSNGTWLKALTQI